MEEKRNKQRNLSNKPVKPLALAMGSVKNEIAKRLDISFGVYDFTLPQNRNKIQYFSEGELVIFGTPVYAGRVPNKLLPAVQTLFQGNGALAVPVVTFGNRSYDNALIELRNELENNGFHTIAAAAFVSEHAFSSKIASDHPDKEDITDIHNFAKTVAIKVEQMIEVPEKAKYFDDTAFLSHVVMLENNYIRRAKNEVFI